MLAITSPDLCSPTAPDNSRIHLEAEIEGLGSLDLHALRVLWRKLLRGRPPEHLSRGLLLRILAYKTQARALGDLDRETACYLDRVAQEQARRRRREQGRRTKAPPPVPPVPVSRGLKEGTLLAREFGGTMHTVIVVSGGFVWDGATYTSLSEIARLITGTRWNGPRFFGLRDKRTAAEEVRS
jgi:Protein of unknown function (DUF2924)